MHSQWNSGEPAQRGYQLKNGFLIVVATASIASPSLAAPGLVQRSLDGVWKLTAFMCERGTQDPVVVDSQRRVDKGLEEETLTIKKKSVKVHNVAWQDDQKKGSCTIDSKQTWEISDTTIEIKDIKVLSQKSKGTEKCPDDKNPALSHAPRPYLIDGKRFKFVVSLQDLTGEHKKNLPSGSFAPCKGGRWIRTYEKSK